MDVYLFPAARNVLKRIREGEYPNTKFAIASRTRSVDWAHKLLEQFDIRDIFDYVEIFPGDKRRHFANIRDASGCEYSRMLFFDDNRDGKFGNCVPVSTLGVLAVHCPDGLIDDVIWTNALRHYRDWSARGGGTPGTIVERDNSITIIEGGRGRTTADDPTDRLEGRVKYLNRERGYGFIAPTGKRRRDDVFFHFSALPDGRDDVEEGDEMTFAMSTDPRRGKVAAENIVLPEKGDARDDNCVTMRAFSMNMPFAALLGNGYKTIETRNGTMFAPYPEGTRMLLHVGQRTYPDGNRHMDVMKSGGLDEDDIRTLKSLPPGFSRGMAVAMVELGKTYETTLERRCDPEFQRAVAAFGEDSGMRATDIRRVEYLKRGVEVPARGGVFKVNIPRHVIPDGWLDSDDDDGPANKEGVFYSATF